MANKRMFSMKIVDSDAFLDMPLSAQCLYFHLNMRADDDGFVGNAKRILRMVGAADDDMKLLISKRFVLVFDDGVIVIKHWRMHNTLSSGRYHETQYIEEKSMLLLKENNAYSMSSGKKIDDSAITGMFSVKRRASGEQVENADIDIDVDKEKGSEEEKSKQKGNKKVYFPNDEKLDEAFRDFIEMRKKMRKSPTERATNLLINRLVGLSTVNGVMDNDKALSLVDESIEKGWLTFYDRKDGKKSNGDKTIIDEWSDA